MNLKVLSTKAKPRKHDFIEAVIDNGATLVLHRDIAMRWGISEGNLITGAALEKALAEDEELRCRDGAWRLLSLRPRSRKELEQALRQRRFPKALCERVVEDLAARGYIDDAAFAKVFAEEKRRHHHGPRLIEQQLKARGISGEHLTEATAPARDHESQSAAARALLTKWNRRSKPEELRKRRLAAAQFLMRRGFDSGVAWDAVRDVLGDGGGDDHIC